MKNKCLLCVSGGFLHTTPKPLDSLEWWACYWYANETFLVLLNSFRMGTDHQKDQSFQLQVLTLGRGERLELITNGQWFHQSCLGKGISIETPKWWDLESFHVGEHIEVLGISHLETEWKLPTLHSLPYVPLPLGWFCIFYNKPV